MLNFQINDYFLIVFTLHHAYAGKYKVEPSHLYRKNLRSFLNLAWDKSPKLYSLICGIDNMQFRLRLCQPGIMSKLYQEADDYIAELQETHEYAIVRGETKKALESCREEWEANEPRSMKIMGEITGLHFTDTITVNITHPAQTNGRYLGDGNIGWTFWDNKWPNYNTVYLWHETLHHYLGTDREGDLLCELFADNYLRTQLNGGDFPPFEGKPHHFETLTSILPLWKVYKAGESKDALQLKKKVAELIAAK